MSIGRNDDNLQAGIFPELLKDMAPPIGKIVYHENTDKGFIADSLLQRVQYQINRLMVLSSLLQYEGYMRD